jgi:hypothetical protein
LLAAGCAGHRKLQDPTVNVATEGGRELGVTTTYGIVFLGHTATTGELEVTAWFGDGPSIESSAVEPIGGGLFTAETEIRLPDVPINFRAPEPGETVLVMGRRGWEPWQAEVTVLEHPSIEGILLSVPPQLRGSSDQIGAGVYYGTLEYDLQLVGLVSGRVLLGERGEFEAITVVGPDQLWRLAAHRREIPQPRIAPREDVR